MTDIPNSEDVKRRSLRPYSSLAAIAFAALGFVGAMGMSHYETALAMALVGVWAHQAWLWERQAGNIRLGEAEAERLAYGILAAISKHREERRDG